MNFSLANSAATGSSVAATPAAAAQHKKLTDAAQQFEGMLLQEMLKPMKEHGFAQDGSDDGDSKEEGSSYGDTLTGFGAETLATAIARGGGLGIAKRVVTQVEGENAAHLARQSRL